MGTILLSLLLLAYILPVPMLVIRLYVILSEKSKH